MPLPLQLPNPIQPATHPSSTPLLPYLPPVAHHLSDDPDLTFDRTLSVWLLLVSQRTTLVPVNHPLHKVIHKYAVRPSPILKMKLIKYHDEWKACFEHTLVYVAVDKGRFGVEIEFVGSMDVRMLEEGILPAETTAGGGGGEADKESVITVGSGSTGEPGPAIDEFGRIV